MGRFYCRHIVQDDCIERYYITIAHPGGLSEEIEVSQNVYDALDDLQREYWRIERKEARHTLHLEMMPYGAIPQDDSSANPEQILLDRLDAADRSSRAQRAFSQIPATQQKRFLLRYFAGLSIKEIADHEGCSERAIKYSLALAQKNLRKLLAE